MNMLFLIFVVIFCRRLVHLSRFRGLLNMSFKGLFFLMFFNVHLFLMMLKGCKVYVR